MGVGPWSSTGKDKTGVGAVGSQNLSCLTKPNSFDRLSRKSSQGASHQDKLLACQVSRIPLLWVDSILLQTVGAKCEVTMEEDNF